MRTKNLLRMSALCTAVCICINSNSIYAFATATTEEKLEAAEGEYAQTKDKIDEEQDNLKQLKGEKNDLVSSLDNLNDRLQDVGDVLEELQIQIYQKNEEIDKTWGQIEDLATQIDEARNESEKQYELIKTHIKFIYETGGNIYQILMSGSDNYADYINRSSFVQMLTEYEQNQLEKLKETKEKLIDKQTEYENCLVEYEKEKTELDEYEREVVTQLEKIEGLIDDTADSISSYDDKIEATQAQMVEYEDRLAAQESNIDNLKKQIEEEKKITEQAGNASWREVTSVATAEGDRKLLANIIYTEAGNEPYIGKVAVGAVVMNRVRSSVFPDTIVGVIYQKRQFSPVASGRLALALAKDSADEDCYKAADAALSGVTNVDDCLYFRTPVNSITPRYVIGGHIFY